MKKLAFILAVVGAIGAAPARGDLIMSDDLAYGDYPAFLQVWTVTETGDQGMAWWLTDSAIHAANEIEGGANDQSVIFGLPVDTTGFRSIHVAVTWWANNLDDFEATDFIRLQGYASDFSSEATRTIEATTEGLWVPGVNPPTTPTVLEADFGLYSADNPALWVGVELNTSLTREILTVDHITVTGTPIPEPATISLLAIGTACLLVWLRGSARMVA